MRQSNNQPLVILSPTSNSGSICRLMRRNKGDEARNARSVSP
jgi:hypothetical protein